MKTLFALLAVLVTTGTAFAQVDPARPMVTGHGNVTARPAAVLISNQVGGPAGAPVMLDKFQVTGSLIRGVDPTATPTCQPSPLRTPPANSAQSGHKGALFFGSWRSASNFGSSRTLSQSGDRRR